MVGKIILFTILILIAIILIVLIVPLGFDVLYENDVLSIDLKILNFIKLKLLPKEKKASEDKEEKKNKPKTKKKKKSKGKAVGTKEKATEKKKKSSKLSLHEIIMIINDLLPPLGTMLYRWLKAVTVTECLISIIIYNEDYAQTGKKTGEAYAELYGCYTLLSHYINIKDFRPMVTPNYINTYSSTYVRLCVKVRPIAIIGGAVVFLCKGGKEVYRTFFKDRAK